MSLGYLDIVAGSSIGSVVVGSFGDGSVTLKNTGYSSVTIEDITIEIWPGDPDSTPEWSFLSPPAFPIVLDVNDELTMNGRFTPLDPGFSRVAFLVVGDGASNIPLALEAIATGIASTGSVKAISVNPSVFSFGEVRITELSAEKTFVVTNTGEANVDITGLTLSSDFLLTTGSFPQTLVPAGTYNLGITFNPAVQGAKNYNAALAGTMDAGDFLINLLGVATVFTPAYTIAFAARELLVALYLGPSTVSVKKFDHMDLNTEEQCFIRKTHLLPFYGAEGRPVPSTSMEKQLMRLGVHYEDLGQVTVRATVTGHNRASTTNQLVTHGSVAANGRTKWGWHELRTVDELLEIELLRVASAGPLSLHDYHLVYEPKGETRK